MRWTLPSLLALPLLQVSIIILLAKIIYTITLLAVVADDDQFIPGSLDWLQLLRVVKDHPGYYTHAMSTL